MKYNSEKIDSLALEIDELKSERENLIYLDIINCVHENGNSIKLEKPMVLAAEEYYLPCQRIQLSNGYLVLSCIDENGQYIDFEGVKNISSESLSYIHDALRNETFIY